MEKKILKWSAASSVVLTVCICIGLYYLPAVNDSAVFWLRLIGKEVEIEIEEGAVATEEEQLYIELPEDFDGKNISVKNDYLTQTIYVRFAQAIEDYTENYSVRGGSNHVANMSYYKEGEAGVLAIHLDKVCEISYIYKDGNLCVKLVDPHDIYDKIVVVDAGHGGRMPGAVKRGIYEKTINLNIVKQIKAVFDEADDENIKVYYTRLDDTNPSLAERTNLSNYLDADLFISIHNNASNSGLFNNQNGTLILYSADDVGVFNSRRFAEICMKHITECAGSLDLGYANGDDLYVVRNNNVPAILIEVGYMTNTTELNNLMDTEYQRKVAQGIYNAVIQAFEEGY